MHLFAMHLQVTHLLLQNAFLVTFWFKYITTFWRKEDKVLVGEIFLLFHSLPDYSAELFIPFDRLPLQTT